MADMNETSTEPQTSYMTSTMAALTSVVTSVKQETATATTTLEMTTNDDDVTTKVICDCVPGEICVVDWILYASLSGLFTAGLVIGSLIVFCCLKYKCNSNSETFNEEYKTADGTVTTETSGTTNQGYDRQVSAQYIGLDKNQREPEMTTMAYEDLVDNDNDAPIKPKPKPKPKPKKQGAKGASRKTANFVNELKGIISKTNKTPESNKPAQGDTGPTDIPLYLDILTSDENDQELAETNTSKQETTTQPTKPQPMLKPSPKHLPKPSPKPKLRKFDDKMMNKSDDEKLTIAIKPSDWSGASNMDNVTTRAPIALQKANLTVPPLQGTLKTHNARAKSPKVSKSKLPSDPARPSPSIPRKDEIKREPQHMYQNCNFPDTHSNDGCVHQAEGEVYIEIISDETTDSKADDMYYNVRK